MARVMFIRRSIFALAVSALVFCLAALLSGQDVASVTGVVTDQSGAVLPGVNVALSNPQTSVSYSAVTNDSGSYFINQVKPGPGYKIEFSHGGFNNVVVSDVYMNVDTTRTQNATLIAGGNRETVEVSAASQEITLDTTDTTVGNNFQVQFLNDLPVEDRSSPSALFVQQPGTTLDGSVTGARTDQDRVTVDGLDVNDMATGQFGAIVGNAPVDSVQEFRGVTAGYMPGANGGGGGQFELVTRSGTNSFHGALVEYHRDTDTEANDWFNNNNGVARPPLIRNQFGGNIGGPIIKDKLYFFFDYNARRDTLTNLVDRTVPMDSFRGDPTTNTLPVINYVNVNNQLGTVSNANVQNWDPQGIGFNPDLLSLFYSRYPHANDFSGAVGDLINFAGFRFNAPFKYSENDYVQRVDFNLNNKMKLFGRGTFTRTNGTEAAIWFPGDPLTYPFIDQSYSWVVSHIWTISSNKVNQAYYGEVFENYNFPNTYNPTGPNQFQNGFGPNGSGGNVITGPYGRAINAQGRTYPIPVIRDDFSWDKGSHSVRFGGTFKYITPKGYTILDYNTPSVGLGGYFTGLDSSVTQPTDICPPSSQVCYYAQGLYNAAFALALAPYSAIGSIYNYNVQGNALPQGTGLNTQYRYYETELYFGDTWKVSPKLTLTYGVRWQNYSVPYETHGLESVQSTDFQDYLDARVAQSAASISGNLAVPLISYSLGGKANHAPGYFAPQRKNFGPRIGFAYSPESKTVINGGVGVLYDQTVVNAVQYQQSQYSYLFQLSSAEFFGVPNGSAAQELASDPRFTGLTTVPAPPAPTPVTEPFYPYVVGSGSSAVPYGLSNGFFNETIDTHFKTPYSINITFGVQHEFPKGFLLRSTYVGRLGRRLLAQADASQLIDFADPASGQLMSQAFGAATLQLRSGQTVQPEPWYEDILPQLSTTQSNTAALAGSNIGVYMARGDFADFTQALSLFGLLPPNIGMASQFAENTFYTNEGFSNYHGWLTTLHKNVGAGLQFDLNYTYSHSIDNVSVVANTPALGGYGFICDVLRQGECRGNSDFDVRHYINGNFIYDLPFGRGRAFAGTAPRWADEIIGGWTVSGLPSWHTGNVYFAQANAFVAGYANDAPAILTGPVSDLKAHLNGGKGAGLYAYTNTPKALSDYTGPVGFSIGTRNNLYGPGYFDLDLGLGKSFPLVGDRVVLKFRADAFNALNHPNFTTPCTDITQVSCLFGTISSTQGTGINNGASAARVLQGALRLEF
jgi:Carboxypeptidase regulatory-like domain